MEGNRFSLNLDGRELTVTCGKYAEYSNGSCIVACGESQVMVNVTMSKAPRAGMDFFPLGVDF